MSKKSPVRDYRVIVKDSNDPGYVNRILIATPSTGLVRVEWVAARYGQIVPCNWSHVEMRQFMDGYYPLRYQVADAQNLIVQSFIEKDFEWLLLYEHDVMPPADAFIKLNQYMQEQKYPVISGLYYTRSYPSEPILYRGRGVSYYKDWKLGDKVWVDGVPTGFLLVHQSLMRSIWNESPEYWVRHDKARRVFDTPRHEWTDPETGQSNAITGTSDLDWCTRIMREGHFKKSGWDEFQDKEFPFLVDTSLFCKHIEMDGRQFP